MDCEIITDVDHERVSGGDRVNAKILLSIDKPVSMQSLTASFLGYEEVELRVSDGGSDDHETKTIRRREVLADDQFLLAGSNPAGWIADTFNSIRSLFGQGQLHELAAGDHEFNVSWSIPERSLPSYQGTHAEVVYRLSVRVHRPLRLDDVFDLDFTVYSDMDDNEQSSSIMISYPNESTGLVQRTLGKSFNATVTLEQDCLRSGDTVVGVFKLINDEPLDVKGISVGLTSEEKVKIDLHREKKRKRYARFELTQAQELAADWQSEISFPVASPGSSSMSGRYFSLDWYVEIHVDIDWAKDTYIRVPVKFYAQP